jgi:RNA polymerase sigma-70 factor (ECF subfamily)
VSDLVPHIPGLRRYARLLTGDATRADDLVQDTLERALRKWRLFGGGAGLRSWLLTIMHNLWASQVRGLRVDEPWTEEDHAHAMGHVDDDSLIVALRMDTQRALATLPETQRAVLLLVVIEELSYAEVAKVLDLPPGTVMSRLSRARAAMRAAMVAPGTATSPRRLAPTSDAMPGSAQAAARPGDNAASPGATPTPSVTELKPPATQPWRVIGGRQ